MIRKAYKRNTRISRRAASAVEFALIAPLMISFTFGLIEFGRLMLVKQTATHATREGARVAVRPSADSAEVIQRVNEELALLAIEGATIELEPAIIETAAPGTLVNVRVRIDMASVSWIPGFFDFSGSQMVAETAMRRESTN